MPTHDPLHALAAAVSATRTYQAALRQSLADAQRPVAPFAPATAPAAPAEAPDAETLGRLAAPVVSRLLARDIRERRSVP